MNTPQWIEAERQRIRNERWLARIEGAAGMAVVILWTLIIIEAIRGLVR